MIAGGCLLAERQICTRIIQNSRTLTGDLEMMHRLAESGLRVAACASLLSGMETSPSHRLQVPVLADQDFEDMFLADTRAGQAGQSGAQGARPCCLSTIYRLIPRLFSILTILIFPELNLKIPPSACICLSGI